MGASFIPSAPELADGSVTTAKLANGAATYIKIGTDVAKWQVLLNTTFVAGAASVVVTIPAGITAIKIFARVRSAGNTTPTYLRQTLNADTTDANYWYAYVENGTSGTAADRSVCRITQSSDTANIFGGYDAEILNNAVTNKTSTGTTSYAVGRAGAWTQVWKNNAAITSVTLTLSDGANFDVGSGFIVLGL